ncbi:hypothetical protein DdX_15747 [Ditylenchus destructor]|uniref:Uncharacterized protein n=1 Tax=Ditylenchus destructor TaxID=166010 RepID=A0AAD4MS99_9BILA|nr:hypothetical protein DdX_15747 [Ditylenchus destructor]
MSYLLTSRSRRELTTPQSAMHDDQEAFEETTVLEHQTVNTPDRLSQIASNALMAQMIEDTTVLESPTVSSPARLSQIASNALMAQMIEDTSKQKI